MFHTEDFTALTLITTFLQGDRSEEGPAAATCWSNDT